jgi:hypothetical protein
MKINIQFFLTMLFPLAALCTEDVSEDQRRFDGAASDAWQEVFFDDCSGQWEEKWFLDGEIGAVETSPEGMKLSAGPQFRNDAHHMVLWTKQSFEGDLKVEFDYTRLDFETRCVNILYIQATGSGKEPYEKDIYAWRELRRTPAMSLYFNHMNLYHVSFAAFPNNEDETSYIRGRRYMPETGRNLAGTDLKPDYYPEGLFEPGKEHHIIVIKKGCEILMRIENEEQTFFCRMSNPDLPTVTEGRIGLRHMYTRSARYKDFRVFRMLGE